MKKFIVSFFIICGIILFSCKNEMDIKSFKLLVQKVDNGHIELETDEVTQGDIVYFTVHPEPGYSFVKLYLDNREQKYVFSNGKYSFCCLCDYVSKGNHTVKPEFILSDNLLKYYSIINRTVDCEVSIEENSTLKQKETKQTVLQITSRKKDCVVENVNVLKRNGEEIEVTKSSDNKYSFIMPSEDVYLFADVRQAVIFSSYDSYIKKGETLTVTIDNASSVNSGFLYIDEIKKEITGSKINTTVKTDNLELGKHTLKAEFGNYSATVNFIISSSEIEEGWKYIHLNAELDKENEKINFDVSDKTYRYVLKTYNSINPENVTETVIYENATNFDIPVTEYLYDKSVQTFVYYIEDPKIKIRSNECSVTIEPFDSIEISKSVIINLVGQSENSFNVCNYLYEINLNDYSFTIPESDTEYFHAESSSETIVIHSDKPTMVPRKLILNYLNKPCAYCSFTIKSDGTISDLFIQKGINLFENINLKTKMTSLILPANNSKTIYFAQNLSGLKLIIDSDTTEEPAVLGEPSSKAIILTDIEVKNKEYEIKPNSTMPLGKYLVYFEYEGLYSSSFNFVLYPEGSIRHKEIHEDLDLESDGNYSIALHYFSSDIDVSKISFEVSEQDKNYFEYEVNSNKELCIYSILKSDEERTIIIKENNIPATYCKFKINENGTFKDLFIQRRFMLYESLNEFASNELTNLSIDNRNEEITIYVREGAFSNSGSNNINRTGVTMYMDPTTTESPAVIGTPSANVIIQTVNIEDGKISFTIPDTLEAGKYLTYFEYDGLYSIAVEIAIK